MPSVSNKQRRFMAAAAHNPQFAAKAGIPQKVAQEFNHEDSNGSAKQQLSDVAQATVHALRGKKGCGCGHS